MCELLHTFLVFQECFVGDGWPPQTVAMRWKFRPFFFASLSVAAGADHRFRSRWNGNGCARSIARPVENRPGAASTIGAAEAIRSRPDGYTLFLLPISLAVTANFYSKPPYNIVHDTSPIALLYQANYVMVVNPSFPVCLMYRPWLSTCPITHLTAGSALPGRRISLLRSSRYSTGRSLRRSLGQQSGAMKLPHRR